MNTLTFFPQIVIRIIKEQESVIGSLAWDEAEKVTGLQVLNKKTGEVNFQNEDAKIIINRLVAQYEKIFGKASHAVCHDAVQDIVAEMNPDEVPESLK